MEPRHAVIVVIVTVYAVALIGNVVIPPLLYYMGKWWDYWGEKHG